MILGLICARGGSKGIPGKNLKDLAGKPLILHTLECATACLTLDDIIVSTDSAGIAARVEKEYYNVQIRPAKLATDSASKWDVFKHVAKKNNLKPDDILVDLDTGCPMRTPEDITTCVDKLRSGKYGVVATAYKADRNPYFNMVDLSAGIATVCKEIFPPITRRQDAPVVYSLSPAVFSLRVKTLSLCNHWSEALLGISVIPRERAWDIDTEFDWQIVEYLMGRK